jgi:shikimate dehydrogenase
MKRACVVGWPIAHSRSPLIHGYWLRRYGIEGSYTKEAVRPEEFEAFVRNLAHNGFQGCNVTVPHKEAAFRAAGIHDPTALAVGAANTLWIEGGRLHAANSDTYGFIRNLDAAAPAWRTSDGPVAILGAGGTARAAAFGLASEGCTQIRIVARTTARAEEIAHAIGPQVKVVPWSDLDNRLRDCRVVANTTTLGMNGIGAPELDFGICRPDMVVTDAVYIPLVTPFLAAAQQHGLKTVDGLGMLLHQAVLGFSKWFSVTPEVTDELRQLIVRDLEASH